MATGSAARKCISSLPGRFEDETVRENGPVLASLAFLAYGWSRLPAGTLVDFVWKKKAGEKEETSVASRTRRLSRLLLLVAAATAATAAGPALIAWPSVTALATPVTIAAMILLGAGAAIHWPALLCSIETDMQHSAATLAKPVAGVIVARALDATAPETVALGAVRWTAGLAAAIALYSLYLGSSVGSEREKEEEKEKEEAADSGEPSTKNPLAVLLDRRVACLSSLAACHYFVLEGLLAQYPRVVSEGGHGSAGAGMALFEVGGIAGSVVAVGACRRFAHGRPVTATLASQAAACALMLTLLPALRSDASSFLATNHSYAMGLLGFLLYTPLALVSFAGGQVAPAAKGTVSGAIGCISYAGAAFAGAPLATALASFGPSSLPLLLAGGIAASAASGLPLVAAGL
jgi:sugar phosphate permease